jgi:hypothetical protein
MGKAGRVFFLVATATVLVLITIWLIGLGDDYHYANPSARDGLGGRILFFGQFALSILPAVLAWQCVRAAWRLLIEPAPTHTKAASQRVEASPAIMSADEQFAVEAAQVGERRQAESSNVFRALSSELADTRDKLSRAKDLVDRSRVGYAALKIHRLSWRSPDSAELKAWEPTSTSETPDGEYQRRGMTWTWGGKRFGLKLIEHPSYGQSSEKVHGEMVVWADGAEVLKLNVSTDATDLEDGRWSYTGVSGLKPGDWMAAFADFCGELELIDSTAHAESQRRYYTNKAAGIELPADDE